MNNYMYECFSYDLKIMFKAQYNSEKVEFADFKC